jgi:hypothetical protein
MEHKEWQGNKATGKKRLLKSLLFETVSFYLVIYLVYF